MRRRNGSSALKPELLDKLLLRLKEPLDDGGLWTSAKVAAFLARELGLERVAVQRGWEPIVNKHVGTIDELDEIIGEMRHARKRA